MFSLRTYFPSAEIKGIDVDRAAVTAARRQVADDDRFSFECAGDVGHEPDAAYDAIFCMAVLRDGRLARPGVTRSDPLLRFEDFARTIDGFDRCLKPGGLLVLRHSNFRLRDTPAAARFELLLSRPAQRPERTPVFGPDNRLIAGADNPETVFRKLT